MWVAVLCLAAVGTLELAGACGGSDATTTGTPSAATSTAASSPSAEPSESAASLPAPTVAGTIAFSDAVPPADGSFPTNADIFVVRADGTHLEQLTDGPELAGVPVVVAGRREDRL